MAVIRGRVGGSFSGYSCDFKLANGKLYGRLGGAIVGADVTMELFDDGCIEGRLGGAIIGKHIQCRQSGATLNGRIGGAVDGNDVRLEYRDGHVTGRWGGEVIGFDYDLEVTEHDIHGRLGGSVVGHSVLLEVSDRVSPLLCALLAGLTYYQFQKNSKKSSSSGSRSGG
jgi:hypothetical protein